MDIEEAANRCYDAADWYVLRKSADAWQLRAPLYVLILTVSTLLGAVSAVLPEATKEFFLIVWTLYALICAVVWLRLSFRFREHVYRGSGLTIIVLFFVIAAQPWVIALAFAFNDRSFLFVARIFIIYAVIFQVFKTSLFCGRPRPYAHDDVRGWAVKIGLVSLVVLATLAFFAVRGAGDKPQSSPDVAVSESSVAPVTEIVKPPLSDPAEEGKQLGLPEQVGIALIVIAAVWLVLAPLFDFPLHRRLFLGPVQGDDAMRFRWRIARYSILAPVWILGLDFALRTWSAGYWATPEPRTPLIFEILSFSWYSIVAAAAFFLLSARSFQPYLNEIRAKLAG